MAASQLEEEEVDVGLGRHKRVRSREQWMEEGSINVNGMIDGIREGR